MQAFLESPALQEVAEEQNSFTDDVTKEDLSVNSITQTEVESSVMTEKKEKQVNNSSSMAQSTVEDTGFNLTEILNKENRTDKEAWFVYSKFKSHKFFNQLMSGSEEKEVFEAATYICKKIKYIDCERGTVVMKQGDYSDGKVYIALSGELLIIVDMSKNGLKANAAEGSDDGAEENENNKSKEGSASPNKTNIGSPQLPRSSSTQETSSATLKNRLSNKPATAVLSSSNNLMRQSTKPGVTLSKTIEFIENQKQEEKEKQQQQHGSISSKNSIIFRPTISSTGEQTSPFKRSRTLKPKVEEPLNTEQYGVVVNKLFGGTYFGERAVAKKHKRNATIMASTKVELLTIDQEDFQYVQNEFNKTKKQVLAFLGIAFPNLDKIDSPSFVENLSYKCDLKNPLYHHRIIEEGRNGEEFFLVFEGKCELIKTIIYDKSDNLSSNMAETKSLYGLRKTGKEEIVIMTIEKGTFFGDEILFSSDTTYEYSVRICSEKAKLLSFKKAKFLYKCPKQIVKGLNDLYTKKKDRIRKILMSRLEKKGAIMTAENLEEIRPVVAFPKKQSTYGPDLHQKRILPKPWYNQSETLQETTSLSPLKSRRDGDDSDVRGHTALSKLRRMESIRSPKNLLINDLSTLQDVSTQKLGLSRQFTEGNLMSQTQSKHFRSATPSQLRSGQGSPVRGFPYPYPRINQSNPRGSVGGELEKPRGNKNDGAERIESKEDAYINNVNNFKADFGRKDKTVEKKYWSLKVKHGLIRVGSQVNISEVNKEVNLADFVTIKLKEKRFIKPAVEDIKSLNTSPTFRRRGNESPGLTFSSFIADNIDVKRESTSPSRAHNTSQIFRRTEPRQFNFLLDLDPLKVPKGKSSPVHKEIKNIHVKGGSPELNNQAAKNSQISKLESVARRTRSQSKLENLKPATIASIVKMDTQFASGFSWRSLTAANKEKKVK